MNDINSGVDISILDKANETQDTYITNPNMKTADAYIQALQETTMTLIDSILMLAGPEFRKLIGEAKKLLRLLEPLRGGKRNYKKRRGGGVPPRGASTNCSLTFP